MVITQIIKEIVESKSARMIRQRQHEKGAIYEYDVKPLMTGSSRGWIMLDLTTANAMFLVYNALKPENQPKFDRVHLVTLIDFTWKHCE